MCVRNVLLCWLLTSSDQTGLLLRRGNISNFGVRSHYVAIRIIIINIWPLCLLFNSWITDVWIAAGTFSTTHHRLQRYNFLSLKFSFRNCTRAMHYDTPSVGDEFLNPPHKVQLTSVQHSQWWPRHVLDTPRTKYIIIFNRYITQPGEAV